MEAWRDSTPHRFSRCLQRTERSRTPTLAGSPPGSSQAQVGTPSSSSLQPHLRSSGLPLPLWKSRSLSWSSDDLGHPYRPRTLERCAGGRGKKGGANSKPWRACGVAGGGGLLEAEKSDYNCRGVGSISDAKISHNNEVYEYKVIRL